MAKKKQEKKTNRDFLELLHDKRITWGLFAVIFLVGMYLRYWHIETIRTFGWDQARESWSVLDIIRGHLTLLGYPTGIGHLHIGPFYFYFLVPFYLLTHLDPMAANYANIVINILNFVAIFLVAKKIFGEKAALFVILIYATCAYLIDFNQTAWNVSIVPGLAAVIFYAIWRIYQKDFKWISILWALNGFAFHFHFTALFFPLISLLSLIFVPEKKKVLLRTLASIPIYLAFFIPTIIALVQEKTESSLYSGFFSNYYLGFHFRFMLHRLPDAILDFQFVPASKLPFLWLLRFILPIMLIAVILFEKNKERKILGYIFLPWFIIPLIGFTLYGGPLTDYYFIYTAPIVLFILVYLQQKLLTLRYKHIFLGVMVLYWGIYIVLNTNGLWIKPNTGGLKAQKIDALKHVKIGEKIKFNEGDIESYLYEIWTKDAKIK